MSVLFNTSPQLPIPDEVHRNAWQTGQEIAQPGTRLQRYLNQVCVSTLMPWIADATGQTPDLIQGTPASWEIVSGSAIQVGELRLIVLPSEAMDREEFSVPQEWIDTPNWVGDYYVAVEVDTDGHWVKPWGYVTHALLKTQGTYDPISRAYSLDSDRVISDLSILWTMMQFSELTRAEIPTPPSISLDQAEEWIEHLSSISLPRWELPSPQWNALVNNNNLFQQLCTARQTEVAPPASSPIRLGEWLQGAIATGWTTLDRLFQSNLNWAISLRSGPTEGGAEISQQYAKPLSLDDSSTVVLVVGVRDEAGDRRSVSIQVLPSAGDPYLPVALRLAMYSTSGEEVQSVVAQEQTRLVQLRPFRCAPETTFRIQIAWEATTIDEFFVA